MDCIGLSSNLIMNCAIFFLNCPLPLLLYTAENLKIGHTIPVLTVPPKQSFVLRAQKSSNICWVPLSQLWFTPGTLLSHDCLNSGFEGQSLRATHKAISGERDASMRRWREGATCGRASFLFRSWPTKLCSGPKAYSSNDLNFQQTEEMLGDFWWHCWMWKPTVMQSRGNLQGGGGGNYFPQRPSKTRQNVMKVWSRRKRYNSLPN